MLENFIFSEGKAEFLEELSADNISEDAIVFIAETQEIYTHGVYFGGGSGGNLSAINSELELIING